MTHYSVEPIRLFTVVLASDSDEPAITLSLLGVVDDAELGPGPCEGLLIFRNDEGDVIGAQKLVPTV